VAKLGYARVSSQGRSLSPEQVKVAAAGYAAGKTLAELALNYDCSEATMSRALR
jgi:hypothetical protein